MKKRTFAFTVMVVLVYLVAPIAGAQAARPAGAGSGGNGGSSGSEPPDYGDLFVLYRDATGIPILTQDNCQQPIAAAPFDGCINIPFTEDCRLIPVDPETCGVLPEYSIYTQEVDFGRISAIRSPDSVFQAQLAGRYY